MENYTFQVRKKGSECPWELAPSFTKEHSSFDKAGRFANTIVEELDCEVRFITPDGEKIIKDKD